MKSYDRTIRVCACICMLTLVMLVGELSDRYAGNNHTNEEETFHIQTNNAETNNAETKETELDNIGRTVSGRAEKTGICKVNDKDNLYQNTQSEILTKCIERNCKVTHIKPLVIQTKSIVKQRLKVSKQEMEVLYRIVQAEAGGEDEMGKKMVADVIVNRVLNEKFPNTISEVVFQKTNGKVQFSPTKDGRFNSVTITEETREAVDEAMTEEDYTDGALFFVATSKAAKDKVSWFETKLENKGTHGGHTFYQ